MTAAESERNWDWDGWSSRRLHARRLQVYASSGLTRVKLQMLRTGPAAHQMGRTSSGYSDSRSSPLPTIT
jgi:hypothetical protein